MKKKSTSLTLSLHKITQGSIIVFFGYLFGILFMFIGRVLYARNFSTFEYGVFSLCFIILNFCVVFASLGLYQGVPRQISYYLGKKKYQKNTKYYCMVPAIKFNN